MGLDTSHDCWHGAYSGFFRFREALGRVAGLPYRRSLSGFPPVELDIDWDKVTRGQLAGDWDAAPAVERGCYDPPLRDPLLYLLIHSDCDGVLKHGYLQPLADRLEELQPRIEAAGDHYVIRHLAEFITGLRRAQESGEDVKFH
jgi:hypothetical protein